MSHSAIFNQFSRAVQALALTGALLLTACGGGGGGNGLPSAGAPGSGSGGSATGDNVATLTVDTGPAQGSVNQPFVSVTVCKPGTSTCATVDHVLVDTGSYGLRLISSPALANLGLAAVTTSAGSAVGECAQFASGYTWGAVRQADVKIAKEVAANLPIEVISDSGAAYAHVPADCSSSGANIGQVATVGANGILGVGLFDNDCPACSRQVIPGTYYACTAAGACTGSTLPAANQVRNPVAVFATDNNGVILNLPAVPEAGSATLTGTLVFGVGTQANNTVPSSAKIYKADAYGNFLTTYKSVAYSSSFLDSGSNGLYFPDNSIAECASGGWFCPAQTVTLSATNTSYDRSSTGTVSQTLVSLNKVAAGMSAASIGANMAVLSSTTFDWGLPFFYGRSVVNVIQGKSAAGATGPFWAY